MPAKKSDKDFFPNNKNAEAAVLSAMLIDHDCVVEGMLSLTEDQFYRKPNKLIFRAIRYLYAKNAAIDIITVHDVLNGKNALEAVGGIPYLNEVCNVVVTGANFKYHLDIVVKNAKYRSLILLAGEIDADSRAEEKSPEEVSNYLMSELMKINTQTEKKKLIPISELTTSALKKIENMINSPTENKIMGISSGYYELDRLIGGFRPGQFIVLAARPRMGKTTFAANIAEKISMTGKKVAFFSMEQEHDDLIFRITSSMGNIDNAIMFNGLAIDKHVLEIFDTMDKLINYPLYIDDSSTNTPLDIRTKSLKMMNDVGLDIIMIDYVQLMSSTVKKDNRQEEISSITRALKVLAKDLGISVLGLSQCSRDLEKRENKRPTLSDLRESGSLEQDADIVIGIYRDEVYYNEKSQYLGKAEILILKNRNGSPGSFMLDFNAEYSKFISPLEQDEICF